MADTDWDLLSSYAGIISLATVSVYAGSFGSLKAPPKPKRHREVEGDDSDDEDEEDVDRLSTSEAYMFPIIGSAVLFGLYLVVKYLGPEWINFLLTWYFAFFNVGSVWQCLVSVSRLAAGERSWKAFDQYKFQICKKVAQNKSRHDFLSFSCRTPSLYLFPLAPIPSAFFVLYPTMKSAILTDVMALSSAHAALSLGKIDTFATGCVLLSGLFIYDVWWVFGTEVMVKVATSLDIPIKILWAKSITFDTARGYTMLGLGDIVVPGMFVALALRYDFSRSKRKTTREPFAKPYFHAALAAYATGLVTTVAVMHNFKAAQPALLYLSPACMLSFFATALARGELKEAWAWSDEPEKVNDDAQDETAEVLSVSSTGAVAGRAIGDVSDEPVGGGSTVASERDVSNRKHR